MKRLALIFTVLFMFCLSVSAQKITEPKLLGKLYAGGDDLSEFFLHRIIEPVDYELGESNDGKLIVRICSLGDFSSAFIKSPVSPLVPTRYNKISRLVSNEKIFIAQSSDCFGYGSWVSNEYWFVPEGSTLKSDKIISVNNISQKSFNVDDFDFEQDKYKKNR